MAIQNTRPSTLKGVLVTLVLATTLLLGTTGCGGRGAVSAAVPALAQPVTSPTPTRNPGVAVPPDGSTYYGAHLDWADDTPAAYTARLGRAPSIYGTFVAFPLGDADKAALSIKVAQINQGHAKLMLTLMPNAGLASVTPETAHDLGTLLAGYNAQGVDVFLRFAHEMNGSWYAWGQQPTAYIEAFRLIADNVHRLAPNTVMVWAPSYSGGYPFTHGPHSVQPGGVDYTALDTNGDGKLTMDDDSYGPYYPGDSYVDWVGLTDYYWGNVWPWGENELPAGGTFVAHLTGSYNGPNGDERGIPDFYATYAVGHNKPFALAETGALYNPQRADGASNYDIKIAWANQVFASIATEFPLLKALLWFEYDKHESDTGSAVDWRASADPAVRDAFRDALPAGFIFATP